MIKIGGQTLPPKTILLVGSESFLIIIGLLAATLLRFSLSGTLSESVNFWDLALRFGLVVLVCELALYYNDLYDLQVVKERSIFFVRLLQALGVACVVLALFYYMEPRLSLGRGVVALAIPTILALILGWRTLLEATGLPLRRPDRVLIVGTGPTGVSLVREILTRPELNLKVAGFLDEKGENIGKSLVNPGIVGVVSDVGTAVAQERVDRVILSLADRRGTMPVQQLLRLKFDGVRVEEAHSLYEKICGRILLEHLSLSWLILSDGFQKPRYLMAAKRVTDVMISLVALLLSLPLLLLIAVAIAVESGAPVVFRQWRVGWRGRPFEMLKFRSMQCDADENGPQWSVEGDPRVTRVGRFIRRYRLDELPQMFNVLRGEMSLVGPRPEQPQLSELLENEIPLFAERYTVRPGITGWAQIKYQYGSSVEETKTKLEYDLFYIKHLSLWIDFVIWFETVKVVLSGRGAR